MIGCNAEDHADYPDYRPEFIQTFERLANLATAASVGGAPAFQVHTPLVRMNKAEIIRCGAVRGVDYSLTHTCYDPRERRRACGRCDACRLRRRGFVDAGLIDPACYPH